MSALDFPARAMALRASAQSSQTFVELAQSALPWNTTQIDSAGHRILGLGAGTYVADDLADQQLLSDHPAAVFEAGGRLFRLLGNAVTPEQFGCPPYAPGVNAQPYIQRAIEYAEAFGYELKFTQHTYELWTPLRVPDSLADPLAPENPGTAASNLTGFPIVLNRRVKLIAAPCGTTLRRRCHDGSDPAVFGNTQRINDAYGYGYWRGGLIVSVGRDHKPAQPDDRAGPVFVGEWTLDGGLSLSATPAPYTEGGKYRLRPDGTGWDIYDKPLWPGGGKGGATYVGYLAEVYGTLRIRGFAGEAFWGGANHRGLIVRGRIEISDSDAGQFDVGIHGEAIFDADFLKVNNCFQGMERFGGWDVRIGKLVIENCSRAGFCQAGSHTPAYMPGDCQPSFVIDHLETNRNGESFGICDHVKVRNWVSRDSAVSIGRFNHAAVNASIDVLRVVCDRASIDTALMFVSPSSVAGAKSTYNNRVGKLILERTPEAIASGFSITRSVGWSNSLGDGNVVDEVVGEAVQIPKQLNPVPDFHVGVGSLRQAFSTSTNLWNCETVPTLGEGRTLYLLTTTGTVGNYSVTLPSTATFPKGARIVLRHSAGPNVVLTIATTNTRMARRAILVLNGTLEFENTEGSGWRLLGESQVLAGSTTVQLQKSGGAIPAADVSDEATLTLNGAKAGMLVQIAPTSVIAANAQIVARVIADNTVGIRARNMSLDSALALGSATYRAMLTWPS